MTARVAYILSGALALMGAQATALTLTGCDRTTHISHGGEADHVDLGQGRVMWRDWWSQEGTATDFTVVDCAPGTALQFRTQEENMGTRLPFNRTEKALAVIARHEEGARAFATFERMAEDLDGIARDITIATLSAEPCACAVLYPEARGDKTEFKLAG
ncbi:hypothetical protein [uncultured Tateyamaria sp.]|uniref:hypothetical protein n=1 Tax=uncultured Tateyamaria sp. TaxID=455651 RepID=UPI00262034B3|nr:hypothetical protein [uncultured Tateyamaria sp.]